MKPPIIKNLQLSSGISLLLLLLSSAASFISINLLLDTSRMVDKSNQIVRTGELLLSELKDAETGQRGFLLTNNQDFLAPYHNSLSRSQALIERAKNLAANDVSELKNLSKLETLVGKHYLLLQQGIETRIASLDAHADILRQSKMTMDSIRMVVTRIQTEEQRSLLQAVNVKNKLSASTPLLITIAGILSKVISVFFFFKINKSVLTTLGLQELLERQKSEILERIEDVNKMTKQIAAGNYSLRFENNGSEGLNQLAESINILAGQLDDSFEKLSGKDWLQTQLIEVNNVLNGIEGTNDLSKAILKYLFNVTDSQAIAIFLVDYEHLVLLGTLGSENVPERLNIQDGLLGACVLSGKEIIVDGLSDDQIVLSHALGAVKYRNLVILPVFFEGKVISVIELVSATSFSTRVKNLLFEAAGPIGVALGSTLNRKIVMDLLRESQEQKEELQVQTEELRSQAEEFMAQAEQLQTVNQELSRQKEKEYLARKEAEDAKLRAEKANKTTSNFLAVMSHEIRTPMNGVLGMATLLSETNLTEEQKEYVDIINTSGDALIAIINDVLDFSKMGANQMLLEKESFNLRACMEDVMDLFSSRAADSNVDLLFDFGPEVPECIVGDSLRLRQILINLINNALKFTSKGEVILSVRKVENITDNTLLRFDISDTGIGIAKERLADLFKAFSQLDSATTRKYGGTGLGLAISKKLVELMNGEIYVDSELGVGSKFSFVIPTKISLVAGSFIVSDSVAGKFALVADDSIASSNILCSQLTNLGLTVKGVYSKSELLDAVFSECKPDVLFAKSRLEGYSILKILEINKIEIPVIILSKLGESRLNLDPSDVMKTVLRYPVKLSRLYAALEKMFSATDTPPSMIPSVIQSEIELNQRDSISLLLAEDNVINQKLALTVLQRMGYKPDLAMTGMEVVEKVAAYSYDIILMDILMPEMDGLEATRYIRSNMQKQPQIIAMTANVLEEEKNACFTAGMNDFLSKPFKLVELQHVMEKAIQRIQNSKRKD